MPRLLHFRSYSGGFPSLRRRTIRAALGLAPVLVYQLFSMLKTLKEAGLTILLIEQNVHLALAVSDYAYVIAEGRLFTEGLPAQLAQDAEIRRAYLGV